MKKLIFIILLLPTIIFSQTLELNKGTYYVTYTNINSSLDGFNPNKGDVTSWEDIVSNSLYLDSLSNTMTITRSDSTLDEEIYGEFIIEYIINNPYNTIYKLYNIDGLTAFIWMNDMTLVFCIEDEFNYNTYKGILGYFK